MTPSNKTMAPCAGFTLLEVLITLTLLSLLTAALFSSLRLGMQVWHSSTSTTAELDNVRAAEQQIAELISKAYPQMDLDDPVHPRIAFEGAATALGVLVPDAEIKGAMSYATLHILASDGGPNLVLERQRELAATPDKQAAQVLLHEVRALELTYFGSDARSATPYWHREWRRRTRLPLFVRVRASLLDPHAKWSELIVAPQIAGDIDCSANALTGYCQGR